MPKKLIFMPRKKNPCLGNKISMPWKKKLPGLEIKLPGLEIKLEGSPTKVHASNANIMLVE